MDDATAIGTARSCDALSVQLAIVRDVTSGFGVEDVSGWEVVNPETLGRDAKLWIRQPGSAAHSLQHDWLFKPVVVPANGHQQGEDWAEKIVSELGALLGLPCAEIRLAVRDSVPGSISRNVAPDGWNLVVGAILLGSLDPGYQEGLLRVPGRPGHSVGNILDALAGCGVPPGCSDLDAPTVFAGYLVLDAWVGNQDRHDQNWAVLRRAASPAGLLLAASYDHASSLGFNLRDSRREALLRNGGVAAFAERASAHRFEHAPERGRRAIPTLVRTADAALDHAGAAAREHWLERLGSIDADATASVVGRIPGLSDPTVRFILELLQVNQGRLLRECG